MKKKLILKKSPPNPQRTSDILVQAKVFSVWLLKDTTHLLIGFRFYDINKIIKIWGSDPDLEDTGADGGPECGGSKGAGPAASESPSPLGGSIRMLKMLKPAPATSGFPASNLRLWQGQRGGWLALSAARSSGSGRLNSLRRKETTFSNASSNLKLQKVREIFTSAKN